ncbi:murein transglycosylase A [Anaerobaca lacustris]|uniref:peptidoglycan lytic exotransglycosylase n=1 Tax=Anaerobaca lacustris TaxID=3044600 RepID=A0AAW6TXF5_9BACT|nr:MltA domain-containing protein [Sedimentisphaerales bacterium M17dextr]
MRQGVRFGLLLLLIGGFGCRTKVVETHIQYDRPLPPGQLALRKINDANEMPDFREAWRDLDTLKTATERSLNYLSKASSQQYYPYRDISHDRVVKTLEAFLTFADSGIRPAELNGIIRAHFDVYMSVGCDDRGTVLFTGYYTPIFEASFERTARFAYPLYTMPDDLVKGPEGQTLGRRDPAGLITAYPDRAALERSGALKGQELVWLADPFEVYIAHVQGSAKLRMPDGQIITVGYAANSGHEYVSVAKALVADGRIPSDRMSLGAMIDYFRQHPDQVERYTQRNPRYVFFRIAEETPHGSLNEPVTPMRTIATDKSIFPRAALAFISTTVPHAGHAGVVEKPYEGFVLDQDTGGAIRAPGRCDIYMGEGDEAGHLAGQTYQEGRLYYLFLKNQ